MCWKWKYSCGHTADIECVAPKKDHNDPTFDLAYYCDGLPDKYTEVDVPCLKCLVNKAASRDDRNSKGDNQVPNGDRPGQGNNNYCADLLGFGWLNKTYMGVFPWNEEWMIKASGMKRNEAGDIVDDPASKVPLVSMIVRQKTFQFDWDAEYLNFEDELEALSSNQAYGSIEPEMHFVKPIHAAVFGNKPDYDIFGPVDYELSVSPASSRSVSTATSSDLDTPATQLTFDGETVVQVKSPYTVDTQTYLNDIQAQYYATLYDHVPVF